MFTLVQHIRDLIWQPQAALENILAGRRLWPALLCGLAGIYWSTLQTAESLLPATVFGHLYLVADVFLAVAWLALLASLVHLAARLVGGGKGTGWRGHWLNIVLLWGWTEVPRMLMVILTMGGLYIAPYIRSRVAFETAWMIAAFALLFILVLWGFILKLHALRVCYQLSGWPLVRVVLLGLVFYALLSSLKANYVDERAVVPAAGLKAMEVSIAIPNPEVSPWRRARMPLPFDVLTYRRRQPRRHEVVNFVPPTASRKVHLTLGLRPRRRFLGRVVGLPGETVALHHGVVVINGQPQQEPYISKDIGISFPPTQVPGDHYFIVGDNRDLPLHVYHGGIVAQHQILGRLSPVGTMTRRLFMNVWGQ